MVSNGATVHSDPLPVAEMQVHDTPLGSDTEVGLTQPIGGFTEQAIGPIQSVSPLPQTA